METIRNLIARLTKQTSTRSPSNAPQTAARDFDQERETGRTGQMSAADRAWETESKQRAKANQTEGR